MKNYRIKGFNNGWVIWKKTQGRLLTYREDKDALMMKVETLKDDNDYDDDDDDKTEVNLFLILFKP